MGSVGHRAQLQGGEKAAGEAAVARGGGVPVLQPRCSLSIVLALRTSTS